MHDQPPVFEHQLLLIALLLLNIPLYVFLWRAFFSGWRDFFDSLRGVGIINYSLDRYKHRVGWKWAPEREVNALYPVLRLLLFVLGVLSGVAAEYHFGAWLLSRFEPVLFPH
ncbi:hypothetical protein [Rhodanobacter lindaniclasticus]